MADEQATTRVFPVAFRPPADSVALPVRAARPIVVVLGMHSAGTSLCAQILSALGVDMTGVPEDRDVEANDAAGQWERLGLSALQFRVLALFGRDCDDPRHDLPLPAAWWADSRVRPIEREIVEFLRQRMPAQRLFGFKDPRTARLLPLWHEIFKELRLAPKIVLCLRNPAQTARSLTARVGIDPEIGEYRWLVYMADLFRYLPRWETCTIEFERWFSEPGANLDKLRRFLDLEWPGSESAMQQAVSDIVDARLRHDRPGCAAARLPLVRSLYDLARGFGGDPAADQKLARIVDRFSAYERLQRPFHREFERLSRLAAQLPAFEQKNQGLAAALAERSAEAEALRERLAALDADLTAATTRADRAAAELAAAQGALAARDAALARADRAADEQRAELARRDGALSDAIRLAEELGAEVRALQADVAAGDAALARAETGAAEWAAAAERVQTALAASSGSAGRWFEAAVVAPAEELLRARRPRWWRLRRTRLGPLALEIKRWRGRGSPAQRADRARDARQWERAARSYVDVLRTRPEDPAIWVQLGHALKESGRIGAAETAYRKAIELDKNHFDALLPLGDVLRRLDRRLDAVAVYGRALDLAASPEQREAVLDGLRTLGHLSR